MTSGPTIGADISRALHEVDAAFPPAPDLAERLIVTASTATRKVTPPRTHRRFTTPLLAAAACIVLVVGIVIGGKLFTAEQPYRPPAIQPVPTTSGSVPRTGASATTPTSGTTPTTTAETTGTGVVGGSSANPSWLTTLPAATGAPAGFHAAAVDFLDSTVGWALGDAGCPTGGASNCPTLIATGDGGATWTKLTVPPGLSSSTVGTTCRPSADASSDPCVNRVTFADRQVGYLWGGSRTYVTKDGGRTWAAGTPSIGIQSLQTFQAHVFRARVEHPSNGTGSELPGPVTLESTALGSAALTAVSLPWSTGTSMTSLMTAGSRALYAAGSNVNGASEQVLRTTDGVHWTRWIDNPCGPQEGAMYMIGAADGSLIVQCGYDTIRVAPYGSASVGGAHPLPPGGMAIAAALNASELAMVTEAPADPDGLATTGEAFIRSRDGGQHWAGIRPMPTPIGQRRSSDEHLLSTFPDGYYQLIDLGAALRLSHDGGNTWQVRAFG